MEMKDIIKELEERLNEAKAEMDEWAAKARFWAAAVQQAEKEIKMLNDNISNIEVMIEAANELAANMAKRPKKPSEPKAKEVEKVDKEEIVDKVNHRGRRVPVCKINEYDNVDDRWKSQKEAAKALNMDQSDLSKFMKLTVPEQRAKKGYAIVWEY